MKKSINPFDIKVGSIIEYARRRDRHTTKRGKVQAIGATLVFVDCNGDYEDVHYDEILYIIHPPKEVK